jgi:hypothetical protein
MNCLRCRRTLKDPTSIKNKYGRVCAHIVKLKPPESFLPLFPETAEPKNGHNPAANLLFLACLGLLATFEAVGAADSMDVDAKNALQVNFAQTSYGE